MTSLYLQSIVTIKMLRSMHRQAFWRYAGMKRKVHHRANEWTSWRLSWICHHGRHVSIKCSECKMKVWVTNWCASSAVYSNQAMCNLIQQRLNWMDWTISIYIYVWLFKRIFKRYIIWQKKLFLFYIYNSNTSIKDINTSKQLFLTKNRYILI